MKQEAVTWATSDRPLPGPEQSVEQVRSFGKDVLPEHYILSDQVWAFYGQEFYSMIVKRRTMARVD